jgi:hypothetical protein
MKVLPIIVKLSKVTGTHEMNRKKIDLKKFEKVKHVGILYLIFFHKLEINFHKLLKSFIFKAK